MLKAAETKPNSRPKFEKRFLCPRFWGIWFAIALLWLIHLLPLNAQFYVGKGFGKLFYWFATKRRRLASININLCFPELSTEEKHNLVKEHFANLGLGIIETGIVWFGDHRKHPQTPKEKALVTFIGEEHLLNAVESDQGVLVLAPHFTHLEISGLFVSMLTHFHPVYRPHNNALMDYLIKRGRALPRFNAEQQAIEYANPIANSDTRQMLKVLKRKETMILLPDQRYRSKGRVEVPFMGHMAKSNPATSKIAKLTKCLVVPTFTRRTDKFNYEVRFLPPIKNFPSDDFAADTVRLHQLYETEIRENPAQYLWVHNRWDIKKY